IPEHCWVKDPWRPCSYVVRDIVVALDLVAIALHFNSWILWPVYWFAQGTIFWAIFVIGHDCCHGSFSENPNLNNTWDTSCILPFLYRITDGESATGLTIKIIDMLKTTNHGYQRSTRIWTCRPNSSDTKSIFPCLHISCIWSPRNKGSHFNPYSDLFRSSESSNNTTPVEIG
ncbi:omega-3 fatty acid desaturase, endoplasmic reticulum-like, partial [Olea europaea subsp. europaea]